MAFCFKKKESASKAVRRLCCNRIDPALEMLDRRNRLDATHCVRKEIKKLRSILRLFRSKLGRQYRRNNDDLREAAACLTAARDAHVVLNALGQLRSRFKNKMPRALFARLKAALKRNCAAELETVERRFRMVERTLNRVRRRIEKLDVGGKVWPAIAPGLAKGYRRGRDEFHVVHDGASAEHFHQWRKRVKELSLQLRLLRPVWPEELNVETAELEKLADLLGEDHDLFMLQQFVAQSGTLEEVALLNDLIASRQRKLRRMALRLGGRFYAEKPRLFCRRLQRYWKAWQG